MDEPYKVVVWGPGGLGRIIIREIAARPEFALAGVYAYRPEKGGVDAGELAGIGPLGVVAGTDADEVLAVDCDAVLLASRDLGDYASLEEIVRILEFFCNRIVGTLSGLSSEIRSIEISENWDASHISAMQLAETEHTPIPAPEDLPPLPNGMTIKQGQVGRLTIEGRPSLRVGLDIQGSFASGEHFVVPGGETPEPGYHATVVTMLQNAPRVVAAEAGWLQMVNPVPHWAPSFRDSWATVGASAPVAG